MSKKMIKNFFVAVFFIFLPFSVESKSFTSLAKTELVNLFHSADEQCELVKAFIDHKEVNAKAISLTMLSETINKLIVHRESFIERKNRAGRLSEQENRCFILTQELIRKLTNARLAYEEKIKQGVSVKKVALSAGAAVSVFGGLIILKTVTSFDISVHTAVACGLVAGCIVGVVSHYKTGQQEPTERMNQ